MNNLVILARDIEEYHKLIQDGSIPDLNIKFATNNPDLILKDYEPKIVLGDVPLIRKVLDLLPNLRWVQTTWAGVEPLVDPAIRYDYRLTNARNMFGPLMS